MNFVANALFVLNCLVIICNVSTEENKWEPKINHKATNHQESNFDYWEIDHNEASAIYYEPADMFIVKPFELSKKFIISNPRSEENQIQSIGKTNSSSTKEKRNSFSENTTSCNFCVNDTVTDDGGRNVFLDISIAPFSTLRSADSQELTTEHLDVENIQLTEQKLAECIDLHLFKNKDVMDNWKFLLSESKIQIYSQFSEIDLNKEIQKKCKNLEDIIEKNLDLLRRSMPRRIKNATSITTPISVAILNNLDEEDNTSDLNELLIEQTANPFENSTTVSNIPTYLYAHIQNVNASSNLTTEIDNNKSEASTKSSNQQEPHKNISIISNILPIFDNFQQISVSTSLPQKQHRGNQKALEESEIEIPTLFTKELLNGSVISDAHGIESLPNEDFKYFDIPQGKHLQPFNENTNLSSLADDLKITKINERNSTTQAHKINGYTNDQPPPTPSPSRKDSLTFMLAHTTPNMAQEHDFLNQSVINSFIYQKNYTDEIKNVSTSNKQVYENTTTSKNNYVSHDIVEEPKSESKSAISSLNGTLYFDFNGALVPTRFVQNPEGQINIAIDGKPFCDNVLSNFQSIILQRICKTEYETTKSNVA